MTGVIMFLAALFMLAIGFSVAFTFGAVAVLFGLIGSAVESFGDGDGFEGVVDIFGRMFSLMPSRIQDGIVSNQILIAVPLFVFMGIVLQKTKLAEKMLENMALLFGKIRGGVGISTVLVGALLAASTGVVGASVVAMGVISLPVMLKYNYNKALGCGTICASGTLGQIIPPSIVLIILGDVFNTDIGGLFCEAIYPGLALVCAYVAYILVVSYVKKDFAPPVTAEDDTPRSKQILNALASILPPLVLVIFVLGSIFAGIATPTASSAFGCAGAVILSVFYKTFSLKMLKDTLDETVKTTAMIFTILIGATAFSLVFAYTGGEELVKEVLSNLPGEKWSFIVLTMIFIFVLGFFIDFVEISYIVLPILVPVVSHLGINPVYFAIIIAMNLQTSFLTPPFGFSLFFLKGVAPAQIKTSDIYKGVVPFIALQILVLAIFAVILLG